MTDLTEWTKSVTNAVKVSITNSLSEERADIRPSEAYKIIGTILVEESERLAKSVEGLRNERVESHEYPNERLWFCYGDADDKRS